MHWPWEASITALCFNICCITPFSLDKNPLIPTNIWFLSSMGKDEASALIPGSNDSAAVTGIHQFQLWSDVMNTWHKGGHSFFCQFSGEDVGMWILSSQAVTNITLPLASMLICTVSFFPAHLWVEMGWYKIFICKKKKFQLNFHYN